jgi:ATP-dependent helicase/nuclease subunit A
MNRRLVDRAARREAATGFRANLVVTAGAGTGKTSLLVERILNACVGEGIDLPAVVAITFTEKAAAEMRDRLSTAFEQLRSFGLGRRDPDPDGRGEADRTWRHLREEKKLPADAIAARALAGLEHLDQAVIGTIHSLCADLLRRYPREAGIDPAFRVDDGTAALRLARQAWEEWFAAEMESTGQRARLWEEVLAEVRTGTLESLGRDLARCSPPWSPEEYRAQQDAAEAILKARAGGLHDRIGVILGRESGMLERCRKQLQLRRGWLRRLATEGTAGLPAGEVQKELAERSPGGKLAGVSRQEFETVEEDSRKLLKHCAAVDPFIDRCLDLLGPFADAFRDRFATEGYLSFDDLLVRTRDLLRDHPAAREKEKSRIRSLLVDEFQDTDPLQYEIVFLLSEKIGSRAAAAGEVRLESGKLFIVGDPKQSIYRFRGADIEAYRRAVGKIENDDGRVHWLETNFRSPPEVLDPLNDLFEAAFRSDSPAQTEYRRIVAAPGRRGEDPGVRIWSVRPPAGQDGAEQRRRSEGQAIAAWIAAEVGRGQRRYRDIAVLLRAMTPVDLYLRPLREAGIPFVVEGGGTFGERPEVRGFLSLLKLMANPTDGISLLGVLRSPVGGVTDRELARHAAGRGGWRLDAAVDPVQCPAVAETIGALRALRDRIRTLPPDAAVRRVMQEMHLVELNGAAFEGGQRVANLCRLADRVANRAREEHLSLFETVRVLEEEFSSTDRRDPESPLADEALDAVRILTIHKAKGLEFPVVIVPDLARQPGGSHAWQDAVRREGIGQGHRALAVRIRGRSRPATNAAEAVFREISPEHETAESARTFYVACTRARERLILVATPSRSAPWLEHLRTWGYEWSGPAPPEQEDFHHGAVGHEVLTPTGSAARVKSVDPSADEITAAVDRFRRARRGAEAFRGRPWIVSPTGLREALEADGEPAGVSTAYLRLPRRREGARPPSRVAAAAGIAVHRLLQLWDREDTAWLRHRSAGAARHGALAAGADPGEVDTVVSAILDRFLDSELPQRLRELDLIGREIPFETAEGDRLVHGMIDLVYRRDGRYVVADFKTDDVAPGREAELLDRYDAQLAAYARAVQRALALAEPPAREIWSIRTGTIVPFPGTGEAGSKK